MLTAVWMIPEEMTVNSYLHQQHLMSRHWNRSHLTLDFSHVGMQTSPLPAQGKEDACTLSHTYPPPAFFVHQLQGTS